MPSGRRSRRGSAPGGLSGGESVGKGQETGPHLDAVEEGSDDEKTVFIGDKAVEDLLRSSSLSLHNVSRELTRTTLQREAVSISFSCSTLLQVWLYCSFPRLDWT